MKREKAEAIINSIVAMRRGVTDAQASAAVELYPTLKDDGAPIEAGTRINWNGQLKRAAVALWDNADSTPETAPTLWEDINYHKGYRVIPDVITATLAFGLDEIGYYPATDTFYRSKMAGNVHLPDIAPEAWEAVEL